MIHPGISCTFTFLGISEDNIFRWFIQIRIGYIVYRKFVAYSLVLDLLSHFSVSKEKLHTVVRIGIFLIYETLLRVLLSFSNVLRVEHSFPRSRLI